VSAAEVVQRLLWDYEGLDAAELDRLTASLPRKLVRWLAMQHPDNRTRKRFYRATGVTIGHDAVINANVLISDSYKNLVTIGERASVSPNVSIVAAAGPNNSRLQHIPEVRDRIIVAKAVTIGEDAWIGAGSVLLPGVTIGQGAIVGAGSVVTASVPPYTIAAGVPARVRRKIVRPEDRE
jgi:maltose O-acetyltransferase